MIVEEETLDGIVKWAKENKIEPLNGCYHILVPPNNKHIKYGLSRWRYQQRRVRAKRAQRYENYMKLKRCYPGAKIKRIRRRGRVVVRVLIGESALKEWQ